MGERALLVLFKVVRVLFTRTKLLGFRYLPKEPYAILVANHHGSYGPISVMTTLSMRLYPWVTHEVTEEESAARYIQKDFVEPELKFQPPLSIRCSIVIGRICVAIMRGLHAIPVYRELIPTRRSIELSVDLLEEGKYILIFPEDAKTAPPDGIGRILPSFLRVARRFYERHGRVVGIYPIGVNGAKRTVRLGAPIYFDPKKPYGEEKSRIKAAVRRALIALSGKSDAPPLETDAAAPAPAGLA